MGALVGILIPRPPRYERGDLILIYSASDILGQANSLDD